MNFLKLTRRFLKRKRVSFHDPPVSTTVSVQKYIEPGALRSPQNSALKRQERLMRSTTAVKSPRRLETVFKLDTVLTKAVESFSTEPSNNNEIDTSLFPMPSVEIMKMRELSDRHPIFPELLTVRSINIDLTKDDSRLATSPDEGSSLGAKKQSEQLINSRQETDPINAGESCSLEPSSGNDTEMSLDETPSVEIIKTSELNNKDPICPELLTCNDPIGNIAGELSSPFTKSLLIKELEGKVETIADLAKMTELEVNRLCIKAPKVKIAKKALADYASKLAKKADCVVVETEKEIVPEKINVEVQTSEVSADSVEVQTVVTPVVAVDTQTDKEPTAHSSCQTEESGFKSTKDVVATCLKEMPDFVGELSSQLNQAHIQQISTKLPFGATFGLLKDKLTSSNSGDVLNFVLEYSANSSPNSSHRLDLTTLQEYLCKNFSSRDVAKFCVQLLKRIHNID